MEASTTGMFIRKKRKSKGWSQDDLAEKVGVSRNAISDWENDKFLITFDKALVLAQVLEVEVLDIYAGKNTGDMDAATKKALENKIKELSEQVSDVQNITLKIEDQGITSLDVAITALMFALFAMAMGIRAVFPHTTANTICCLLFVILGIATLIFGKKIIRIMEKRLEERSSEE